MDSLLVSALASQAKEKNHRGSTSLPPGLHLYSLWRASQGKEEDQKEVVGKASPNSSLSSTWTSLHSLVAEDSLLRYTRERYFVLRAKESFVQETATCCEAMTNCFSQLVEEDANRPRPKLVYMEERAEVPMAVRPNPRRQVRMTWFSENEPEGHEDHPAERELRREHAADPVVWRSPARELVRLQPGALHERLRSQIERPILHRAEERVPEKTDTESFHSADDNTESSTELPFHREAMTAEDTGVAAEVESFLSADELEPQRISAREFQSSHPNELHAQEEFPSASQPSLVRDDSAFARFTAEEEEFPSVDSSPQMSLSPPRLTAMDEQVREERRQGTLLRATSTVMRHATCATPESIQAQCSQSGNAPLSTTEEFPSSSVLIPTPPPGRKERVAPLRRHAEENQERYCSVQMERHDEQVMNRHESQHREREIGMRESGHYDEEPEPSVLHAEEEDVKDHSVQMERHDEQVMNRHESQHREREIGMRESGHYDDEPEPSVLHAEEEDVKDHSVQMERHDEQVMNRHESQHREREIGMRESGHYDEEPDADKPHSVELSREYEVNNERQHTEGGRTMENTMHEEAVHPAPKNPVSGPVFAHLDSNGFPGLRPTQNPYRTEITKTDGLMVLGYPFCAWLGDLYNPQGLYIYHCQMYRTVPNKSVLAQLEEQSAPPPEEDEDAETVSITSSVTVENEPMVDPCGLRWVRRIEVPSALLRNAGFLPLLETLRWCPGLRELTVSGNELTNEAVEWLAHAIDGEDNAALYKRAMEMLVSAAKEPPAGGRMGATHIQAVLLRQFFHRYFGSDTAATPSARGKGRGGEDTATNASSNVSSSPNIPYALAFSQLRSLDLAQNRLSNGALVLCNKIAAARPRLHIDVTGVSQRRIRRQLLKLHENITVGKVV